MPIHIFVGWTLFVWVTRMRNIAQDDELSTGGTIWRFGAAMVFVVLGLAVLILSRRTPAGTARVLGVLVGWTVSWWLVRGIGILIDDHDLGFKAVHTALMLVSIGLAMWAWRRRGG